MKDGLKWVILVFVAALLVLLILTQKDKFMKEKNTQQESNSVNISIQETDSSEETAEVLEETEAATQN